MGNQFVMDDVNYPIAFSGRELQGKVAGGKLAGGQWYCHTEEQIVPVSPTLPLVRFCASIGSPFHQYLLHRDLTRIAQQDDIGLLAGCQ
ncbi:Uncharacterised protein [Escherichia coli]|uniref:Uncharacterized protein n=1 Tax=Escherichia coli TaxID=562 RepID=A0A376MMF9_ECOLX|nr:Uncharacterised protein [Escherichia coli]